MFTSIVITCTCQGCPNPMYMILDIGLISANNEYGIIKDFI